MSKPKGDADLRQVALYVDANLKAELERRAKAEKKAEKTVVAEALTAHLRGAPVNGARK